MTISTDRKQDILNAAIDIIVREGLTSFTIRKVADAAGISTGLVLYHFESKDKLIEEAWRSSVQHLGERIDSERTPLDGRDWMDATFKVRFRDRDEEQFPSLIWLEYWLHLARAPALQHERVQIYNAWRQYDLARLEKAFAANELRDDLDPTLIVDFFHTLVCGLVVKTAIDSEVFTPERAYELGRFFLSLVSNPAPPQSEA